MSRSRPPDVTGGSASRAGRARPDGALPWWTRPAARSAPPRRPRGATMVSLDQLPEIRTDLFIGGESRGADNALQVLDPADGSSVVGYAAAASAKQAQDAVAAAQQAFPAWAARAPTGAGRAADRGAGAAGGRPPRDGRGAHPGERQDPDGVVRRLPGVRPPVRARDRARRPGRRRRAAARAAVPDRGRAPAARRGDDHRPVQLAAGDPGRIAAAGAAGRQHRGGEAAAHRATGHRGDRRARGAGAAARAC